MKSVFELEDLCYAFVKNNPDISPAIDGGIYKRKRPDNSRKQDVVIIGLVAGNEQLQRSVVNINFHCANLAIKIDSQDQTSQPDTVKLKEITNLLLDAFEDFSGTDFTCEIENQTVFSESEFNEHFVNIRLEFYSFNV